MKIIFDDFAGDKTRSLRSRLVGGAPHRRPSTANALTLNSRLSIKKPVHKAQVFLVMQLF